LSQYSTFIDYSTQLKSTSINGRSLTQVKHLNVRRGASQIGDKPYRWQVNSVTVNSVTSNWWQVSVSSVTVTIYR